MPVMPVRGGPTYTLGIFPWKIYFKLHAWIKPAGIGTIRVLLLMDATRLDSKSQMTGASTICLGMSQNGAWISKRHRGQKPVVQNFTNMLRPGIFALLVGEVGITVPISAVLP